MNSKKDRTSAAIQFSKQSALPDHIEPLDTIWEKLERRAAQIDYGSLVCELQVHEGQVRQIDITVVKERIRAD